MDARSCYRNHRGFPGQPERNSGPSIESFAEGRITTGIDARFEYMDRDTIGSL